MSEIRLVSLFSGSSGNCTAVNFGSDTLLFDAGRSARAIERGLCDAGIDPASVRAIFVTHEHTDHISALRVFTGKHPVPVYAALGTADAITCGHSGSVCRCRPLDEIRIGAAMVRSFHTSHDAECPVCYRVDIENDGATVSLGIVTDTGVISDGIKDGISGCRAVLLESNHDPDMLRTGPYPAPLKQRIASARGHLSNSDSADFAAFLVAHGARKIILAHISKENNLPALALDVCRTRLNDAGLDAEVIAADPIMCVGISV